MQRIAYVLVASLSLVLLAKESLAQKPWSEKGSKAQELVKLPSLQPIIQELDAAVVNISTAAEVGAGPEAAPGIPFDPFSSPEQLFERFFRGPGQQPQPRRSMGSGFFISKDGYIITNNHVIEGADRIEVTTTGNNASQQTYVAELVGRDPRTDIAIIKVEGKNFPFAQLGNSDQILKGDWVLAFGNPFGLDHSVSVGIVSAKGREISPNENRRFDDFIQTDAAINFGNSGGPLVNTRGEVVGINTAITAQGSGIGFAVPINVAKEILPQLIERGSVARGYLGVMIQDITPELQEALGLKSTNGVIVNDIVEDGPSARSALQAGDVILQVDSEIIEDSRSLQRVIARSKPNQTVQVKILREGKGMTLSVRLGALDEAGNVSSLPQSGEEIRYDKLGLHVEKNKNGDGLVVVHISGEASSPLFPEDIILSIIHNGKRHPMNSMESYEKLLRDLKAGEAIVFQVRRGPNTQFFFDFRIPAEKAQ